ncbi:hypothetical protein POM88_045760 [Heracleum sosnowskyi]|uniref:Uncharacterized protein n=1 Tax=Heracleum sosnowskyi TaxID=360622 RepID=A0AAD8H7H3_9APIA|nr:hypothetical protein POM88_045760 [Heracleum sosnowskyi]
MENKITLSTSEVDGLKKTIFEMRSHFDLEFSKLRSIADKQNGSTLDPLSHLNQIAANVAIYRYESELDNIAKAPTTKAPSIKAPSIKAYDRKRKARDVKK